MRHRISKGPTKRLAPTITNGMGCPHSFRDDEGLQLDIECTSCSGAHDLVNKRCAAGILRVLSDGPKPDSIILRWYMHKRYRGAAVNWINLTAEELSTLERALGSAETPSDRRCRTCPASKERVISALRLRILDDPFSYASSPADVIKDVKERFPKGNCERRSDCVRSGLIARSTIRAAGD
jgi:hypothetical protein